MYESFINVDRVLSCPINSSFNNVKMVLFCSSNHRTNPMIMMIMISFWTPPSDISHQKRKHYILEDSSWEIQASLTDQLSCRWYKDIILPPFAVCLCPSVRMSITKIHAREILDSRGNPTVEVDLWTAKGEHVYHTTYLLFTYLF